MERRGAVTVWVRSDHAHPDLIERLARADPWFADSSFILVKDTKKTRVGRLDVSIGAGPHTVYVKRYNAFSLRYRIGSLFSRSAARRALDGARILAEAGIACARPIASVEVRRWGMLEASFFFAHAIQGARTSDAWWRDCLQPLPRAEGFQLRRGFLAGLAALFAGLHARRIYHDDLKDANIMARIGERGGVEFALLDLEGVRRCGRLRRRRRVKNLVQLYRTLGRYLSRSQKLFLLKSYLGAGSGERALRRRMAADVVRLAWRVDRRKAREAGAPAPRVR